MAAAIALRFIDLAANPGGLYPDEAAEGLDADGAEIADIPLDVIAGRGRIFWIADPGVPLPVVPPGYRAEEVRCAIEACLTIYSLPGE